MLTTRLCFSSLFSLSSSPPSLSLPLSSLTDYELDSPPQLVLGSGESTVCFTINMKKDSLLEPDEIFNIVLTTTDESVEIKQDEYEVVIINNDEDSKC